MSASLFISSTPFDLALHRNKIADALSKAKSGSPALRVVLAAPETGLAERLRLVRQAAAYVGVFGMVYGNVDATTGKSLVQLEYEAALAAGLPILIYIMDEDEHLVLPKHVDTGTPALSLSELKSHLSQTQDVRFYESADDLVAKLENDLLRVFAPAPAPVPAPVAPAAVAESTKADAVAEPVVEANEMPSGLTGTAASKRYALTPPRFAFFKEKVAHLFQREMPDAVLQDVIEYLLAGNTMSAASALRRGAGISLEDAIEEVRKTELVIVDTVQRHQAQTGAVK
ncbi:DUF4062 domain-containing protein [Undibacterium sp. CY21W]|uniref:DUF4062 domain-containing protein n=1 Tax=Undibacterium sp. CY21W TaxID=2762293 RepID=UPI00164A910F|nr:DUF4062 domain-containing protein [Undibacterium sp. CY21W]MBC3926880.1 DUF4062 domain-containing protein [Undibacterium sp. CY21W]